VVYTIIYFILTPLSISVWICPCKDIIGNLDVCRRPLNTTSLSSYSSTSCFRNARPKELLEGLGWGKKKEEKDGGEDQEPF